MIAVHMAAITEAMRFCEVVDVDVELMYDIVANAAGNSKVFAGCFQGMKGKGWRVEGVEGGGEVVGRLVSLIFICSLLHSPFVDLSNEGGGIVMLVLRMTDTETSLGQSHGRRLPPPISLIPGQCRVAGILEAAEGVG